MAINQFMNDNSQIRYDMIVFKNSIKHFLAGILFKITVISIRSITIKFCSVTAVKVQWWF